jgi:hypothetical protein
MRISSPKLSQWLKQAAGPRSLPPALWKRLILMKTLSIDIETFNASFECDAQRRCGQHLPFLHARRFSRQLKLLVWFIYKKGW